MRRRLPRLTGMSLEKRTNARLHSLLQAGDAARDRRDWSLAAGFYEQIVAVEPGALDIAVQLGHAYKEMGDLRRASELYYRVLAERPRDDDLYLQIGHLEKRRGNITQALSFYRQAVGLNPTNADAQSEYEALANGHAGLANGAATNGHDVIAERSGADSIGIERIGFVAPRPPEADSANGVVRVPAAELRRAGDRARDAGRWAEATAAYRGYLERAPEDFAIWVQLGHALKESGDVAEAEQAYRAALALDPDDADLNLQLGHVLKLRGRSSEALEAYHRSFERQPQRGTWVELQAMDGIGYLPEYRPSAAARPATVFLDISELLVSLARYKGISGMQRVQLGLLAAALGNDPAWADCGFVIWRDKELWTLPERQLAALVPQRKASAPDWNDRRALIAGIESAATLYALVAGDVIVSTGALYLEPELVARRERLKRAGVRLGAYFHDFIPLSHPEFCERILTDNFSKSASETLLHLDFILTVSQYVGGETRRLLREAGFPQIPVRTVPLAHSLGIDSEKSTQGARWSPAIAALRGQDYVLCVGTLCFHKNQNFLVQVWELLLREGCEPPLLVLAGARNHGADEVTVRLSRDHQLGSRVRLVETPSDDELAVLYQNCLFTMFPSLAEGWGLPIGESLAYGKLCVTSQLGPMREAGGDYALYIDPYNVRACAELLKDLLGNRSKIAAHETRIRAKFKPRRWHEHAGDFIAAVKESAAEIPVENRSRYTTLAPSRMVRPQPTIRDWKFGKALPPFAALAEAATGDAILASGWRRPEFWGAWMSGRYARIHFSVTTPPGSPVTVLLQFRAAPWSRNNKLQVSAACGASVTVPVPESGVGEAQWRGQRYKELVLSIDCVAGADQTVDLALEIIGRLSPGWWLETRRLCLGLLRMAYLPAATTPLGQAPNQRLRPLVLTGPAGETAYPIGLQSLLAAVRGSQMLVSGWEPPSERGAWMSGGTARLMLTTQAAAGELVRVVLQLCTGPAMGAMQASLSAPCGATASWRLPAGSPGEWVWLDCRVGDRGGIQIDIVDAAAAKSAVLPGRIGLRAVAYGRRETAEERIALTEAILYPAPDDRGAMHDALLADLRFTIAGHLKGSYSLAAINRSLALSLEAAFPGSVRVEQIETDPVRDLTGIPLAEKNILLDLADRAADPAGAEIAIVQHWPVVPPPARRDLALALFVWEESLVPRDIVERLNRDYQGIVTQTTSVRKALLDSGIAVPVRMIGCAIDLSPFEAIAARRAAAEPRAPVSAGDPLVFLHVSSAFPRKGVDLLLEAYATAFRTHDPVKLVIKSFPNPHNDLAERIERLRDADPEAPAILLIDEELDENALHALYETADVMVLPTRGEGFNMPAAEAMAAGLPLIVTGHGGQTDFVSEDAARVLDYRFAPSRSHVKSVGSVWVEPEKADLVAALREMLTKARSADDRRAAFAAQVARARQAVAPLGDRSAWGRRTADAVRALLTADPPRFVTIGWVSTWKVRCGIAEYSRHLLDHFDHADRDVTVFCDARTADSDARGGRPRAEIAWRILNETSMDDLAAAIDAAGVGAVVIQQHEGYMGWHAVARLLRDKRVASRPVLIFVHHVQYLFKEDEASRANIIDVLRVAASVLVHSISDLNILKSFGLTENVALFPHGAERSTLAPPPVRGFAGGGGAPLIGAYGFFLPPKGFDRLIQALPALRARWSGLRLRLVTAEYPEPTSAEALSRARDLARALGVAEAIEWHTDYLPNHRSLELLNECDLVVLPYQHTTESASGSVRTALASRAPVAVTPIPIFDDLGSAVLRLPGNDGDAIAAGVAAALESDAVRRELIAEADRLLENYDWRLLAARLHGMVAGIVATRRADA